MSFQAVVGGRRAMAPLLAVTLALSAVTPVMTLPVSELTETTFDQVVDGSKNVLVMFHTPDCGHCKVMESEYEAAAEILTPSDDVVLARVDTEDAPEIGERFDIDGHPIFKWFPKGETEAENFYYVHYSGRMGNTLLKMVSERVDGFTKTLPPPVNYVKKIKHEEFDDFVFDKSTTVLMYLYSPWADRQDIKLAMDKVGKAFVDDDSVQLAKLAIETVKERDIADRFNLKDYPGFLLYPADGEWERFTGEPGDAGAIINLINKRAGKRASLDGRGSGLVTEMEPFVARAVKAVTDELIAESIAAADALDGSLAENARQYVKVMERIAQKGAGYVETEIGRLEGLLAKASITPEKQKLFMLRTDILNSFKEAAASSAAGEGEL